MTFHRGWIFAHHRNSLSFCLPALFAIGMSLSTGCLLRAEERPSVKTDQGFKAILARQNRERLKAVADYIIRQPDADDVAQARQWIFEAALQDGLEADALPAAEAYLKQPSADPAATQQAQQVLCLGLAKSGRLADAVTQFEASLKGVRFQAANRTFDFAQALATQARLAGEFGVSRDVYERVAAAFPLSPQIGSIAESKIAKLELIGQPAPRIGANDLEGKRVDWEEYAGKVVLVDFWATNCPPCLAEFPNMQRLYREFHAKGFEILGVSLDESPEAVDEFRKKTNLPWRMVMNESPEGAIGKRFRLTAIPALYFVDRTGKVAQLDMRGDDMRVTIERLLEKK